MIKKKLRPYRRRSVREINYLKSNEFLGKAIINTRGEMEKLQKVLDLTISHKNYLEKIAEKRSYNVDTIFKVVPIGTSIRGFEPSNFLFDTLERYIIKVMKKMGAFTYSNFGDGYEKIHGIEGYVAIPNPPIRRERSKTD